MHLPALSIEASKFLSPLLPDHGITHLIYRLSRIRIRHLIAAIDGCGDNVLISDHQRELVPLPSGNALGRHVSAGMPGRTCPDKK